MTRRSGASAHAFLVEHLGEGTPPADARLEDVVAAVSASRLPAHPLLSADPELRVRRARGQSFPGPDRDPLGASRCRPGRGRAAGRPGPTSARVIDLARTAGARVVPWGGGTSVVGRRQRPSVAPTRSSRSTSRVSSGVRSVDERSGLVTVGAGTTGPALASFLSPIGLAVGHEPQSWELATVGGWVAARGSGLRSIGVGRIEQLFAGGTLEAPAGTLELPAFPASAAGPDLRQLVLGSEGRLGILTDVVLRATPAPAADHLDAFAVRDWMAAVDAARSLARSPAGLSALRLSTPAETRTLLAFAGRRRRDGRGRVLAARASRARRLGAAPGRGRRDRGASRRRPATRRGAIVARHGGVPVPGIAAAWTRTRFRSPYLRNALWAAGYGADTLETATDWSRVPSLLADLEAAIGGALADRDERVHVMTHLSHQYPSGSSLYLTFLFRLGAGPDETLDRWRAIKRAASETIVTRGATISHHHGVGTDHAPYLAAEKGPLGMAALEAVVRTFDPEGIMNPGVLLAEPRT